MYDLQILLWIQYAGVAPLWSIVSHYLYEEGLVALAVLWLKVNNFWRSVENLGSNGRIYNW